MSKKKTGFNIKGYNDFFKPTDTADNSKSELVPSIAINKLIPFKNHPFKLYEGERLSDMVESIKANGIIMPIILRPLDDDIYEILSGHNRVEAAKVAGLEIVPVIIRENLSDDEALLIVTETNLIQRSFTDLSHSERATSLTVHHEAVKNQGKRTDLINEIENLLKNSENISNDVAFLTSAQFVPKLEAREKTAQNYGLNRGTVTRYLRIHNNLSNLFNDMLDSGQIPFIAAVEISYLSNEHQSDLAKILSDNPELKIDIKKAELIRGFSEENKLNLKVIKDILSGIAVKKKNRASLPVQSLKIGGKKLSKYFKPEHTPEEIQAELFRALEYYRARENQQQ
jgi:ParB family chromosome partitioning protein